MGARAAAGGIAFINAVGNLGGFFGPILMGRLKESTHGSFTAGLYLAAALMLLGACLSYMLSRHSAGDSHAAGLEEVSEDTVAAVAQPDQNV